MQIDGKYKDLKELEMDSRIYLLLRQIGWAILRSEFEKMYVSKGNGQVQPKMYEQILEILRFLDN